MKTHMSSRLHRHAIRPHNLRRQRKFLKKQRSILDRMWSVRHDKTGKMAHRIARNQSVVSAAIALLKRRKEKEDYKYLDEENDLSSTESADADTEDLLLTEDLSDDDQPNNISSRE